MQKPREIAYRLLQPATPSEGFVEERLDAACRGARVTPQDRRFLQELVFGTVRWRGALDWLIGEKTQHRVQKQGLQNLLRLGLYQLLWMERVPDHAAINETVALAKQLGFGAQSGFVNAVLRAYARERVAAQEKLRELQRSQPEVGWSHPDWLCARWQQRWTTEELQRLLEWNNRPPAVFGRLNTLKTTGEKLIEAWREEGMEYQFRRWDWTGENLIFEIRPPCALSELASFRNGLFYVQDPSTLLAAQRLEAQPGEAILDLCAAPGGKTTFIAQTMGNQGRIVAQDIDPRRLRFLQENCQRLGVTVVEPKLKNAPVESAPPTDFDRVLVDVPCSNTGVLRRRVELRWRVSAAEIVRLQCAQGELLNEGAVRVKPGGRLVYSTCSLEPEENEDVVKLFLENQPRFRLLESRAILPFRDGVDGAFVATFLREA